MFLTRLISRLPLGVLYRIADLLFFIGFYLIRYRRTLVSRNLRNAFPDRSNEELNKIEKKFYRNLCDYAVEMLKLLTITKEELSRRVIFTNPEVAKKYLDNNQSVLYLASHQFNWEWLLVTGCLVYPGAMDFVYQSVNSKFFDTLSMECRTRFGAFPIKRNEVAREAVRRKNILRGTAIVADQYPGYGRDRKFSTVFLNQETVFFYGANQIAILTQSPAVYHKIKKTQRGYYEVTLIELGKPPYAKDSNEVIENYVRETERVIVENPAEWLWSHNRWKTRHLKTA